MYMDIILSLQPNAGAKVLDMIAFRQWHLQEESVQNFPSKVNSTMGLQLFLGNNNSREGLQNKKHFTLSGFHCCEAEIEFELTKNRCLV